MGERERAESNHFKNKQRFADTHNKCVHYNNPLTEFQCSLRDAGHKPTKSMEDGKEEIKRIFEKYQEFKDADPNSLPIYFGDAFRNDEIYLHPQNTSKLDKETVPGGQAQSDRSNASDGKDKAKRNSISCLLYTSPSPRD